MERLLFLKFPFTVEGTEQVSRIRTCFERKENAVSFSLPFDLSFSIPKGTLKLKKQHQNDFIYVFLFSSLEDAKDFVESPAAEVLQEKEVCCDKLEMDMNEFMAKYESGERVKKKKVKVYDEDGFYEYV